MGPTGTMKSSTVRELGLATSDEYACFLTTFSPNTSTDIFQNYLESKLPKKGTKF